MKNTLSCLAPATRVPVSPLFILAVAVSSFISFISAYADSCCPSTFPWAPPENLAPDSWLVVGGFPNAEIYNDSVVNGENRTGFVVDYLASAGGEHSPQLKDGSTVVFDGKQYPVSTVRTPADNLIDFIRIYEEMETEWKAAYALGTITLEEEKEVTLRFGSDDAAKVWINGEEVIHAWNMGRGTSASSEVVPAHLNAGDNQVLVKVENMTGGWSFILEVYDDEGEAQMKMVNVRKNLDILEIRAMRGQEDRDGWGFLLASGKLPPLGFVDIATASMLFKPETFSVQWFNEDLEVVNNCTAHGRYIAYVTVETLDGYLYKRMITFYRYRNPALDPYLLAPDHREPDFGLSQEASLFIGREPDYTETHQHELSRGFWMAMGHFINDTEEGAALLSYIEEVDDKPVDTNLAHSSVNRNLKFKLGLKAKLYGVKARELKNPHWIDEPALTLKMGTPEEAGMAPETVANARQALQEWADGTGWGCRVILARNGIIFMYEAVGEDFGQPITKESYFYPASIGKFVAGQVMCQFIDQGLAEFDTPVGVVLKDFPVEGPRALTFRQCFNHVSGLVGHASYGGLYNPLLDNAFWVQQYPFVEIAKARIYGGDGNNLAGKGMEMLSGKTFFELFYEQLHRPLGETDIVQIDNGFGSQFDVMFLAKIGQLVLNKGAYGNYRFYSPEALEKIMPVPTRELYPTVGTDMSVYGAGCEWMNDFDGPAEDAPLGGQALGHGSASASVLRIDLKHDLLIIVGRNGTDDYGPSQDYTKKLVQAVADGIR